MNTLLVKKIGIDTYHENIAYMPKGCEICKSQGFHALSKIEIHWKNRSILATLNMTENGIVPPGKIGLCPIAFERLGAKEGEEVTLSHPNPLLSTEFIRDKLDGRSLNKPQFTRILEDVIRHRFSNIELTAFVIACSQRLNEQELRDLTEAMIETGERIDWGLPLVLDKHCIGGIPGNRTTMIVVPIVAAFGLPIPKTSSRAITSPSGTADTMEAITRVNLTLGQMKKLVAEENACIAWGGSLYLAPADDILISVERPLSLDSEGQMIASILSKKKAAGSTHMILDIPVGPTAKVRSQSAARRLKKRFENIGEQIGLQVKVVFTDGTQPVGRGIGPSLEAQDVLSVLQRDPRAPQDLKEKSIFLAGELLELSRRVKKGDGSKIAREILESGEAWEKFQRIAKKQGPLKKIEKALFSWEVKSPVKGKVVSLHNLKIAKAAKLAGAPWDKKAGVYLHRKVGDAVKKGETLFWIFAETEEELNFAAQYAKDNPDLVSLG
ncbi:MAG: thymidine phosphorylase family protein [bacterium]